MIFILSISWTYCSWEKRRNEETGTLINSKALIVITWWLIIIDYQLSLFLTVLCSPVTTLSKISLSNTPNNYKKKNTQNHMIIWFCFMVSFGFISMQKNDRDVDLSRFVCAFASACGQTLDEIINWQNNRRTTGVPYTYIRLEIHNII